VVFTTKFTWGIIGLSYTEQFREIIRFFGRRMATIAGGPGRPYLIAEIDFTEKSGNGLAVLDDFYAACSVLRYAEIVALSRAIGVTPRTVENWKYKRTMPRFRNIDATTDWLMCQVINWVKRGKPMHKQLTGAPGRPCLVADMPSVAEYARHLHSRLHRR
jgi:hypothetical protein